tara:strand:+ start:849 stop:1754 length:906 start_codon:yes stop_codon:yes gene_type:complete
MAELNLKPKKIDLFADDRAFDLMTTAVDESKVDFSTPKEEKKTSSTEGIHTTLGAVGMVDVFGIGTIADVLDAGLYGLEGRGWEAGLALLSALPVFGSLIGGGGKAAKIARAAARAEKKAQKGMEKQTEMVEGAQSVIKSFGEDPLDPKLVSFTTDKLAEAAEGLVENQKQFDYFWRKMGVHKIDKLTDPEEWANLPKAFKELGGIPKMDFEDALAIFHYRGTKTAEGIKAAKEYSKLGLETAEDIVMNKEMKERALDFMNRFESQFGKGEEAWFKFIDMIEGKRQFAKEIGLQRHIVGFD